MERRLRYLHFLLLCLLLLASCSTEMVVMKTARESNLVLPYTNDNKTATFGIRENWLFSDFEKGSATINEELAKVGALLSNVAYEEEEEPRKALFDKLELTSFRSFYYDYQGSDLAIIRSNFGYKEVDGKHLFVIALRGTDENNINDFLTDLKDGRAYFKSSAWNVYKTFETYVTETLGLDKEELKAHPEKNLFFLTGHSLGGAAANRLSYLLTGFTSFTAVVEGKKETIPEGTAYGRKENIYTYTFSCPNTAKNLDKSLSNAKNYIYFRDSVPKLPLLNQGRFGEDIIIYATDLDGELYKTLTLKKQTTKTKLECHSIAVVLAYLLTGVLDPFAPLEE